MRAGGSDESEESDEEEWRLAEQQIKKHIEAAAAVSDSADNPQLSSLSPLGRPADGGDSSSVGAFSEGDGAERGVRMRHVAPGTLESSFCKCGRTRRCCRSRSSTSPSHGSSSAPVRLIGPSHPGPSPSHRDRVYTTSPGKYSVIEGARCCAEENRIAAQPSNRAVGTSGSCRRGTRSWPPRSAPTVPPSASECAPPASVTPATTLVATSAAWFLLSARLLVPRQQLRPARVSPRGVDGSYRASPNHIFKEGCVTRRPSRRWPAAGAAFSMGLAGGCCRWATASAASH